MSKQEKRFLRRDLINRLLQDNRHLTIYAIITRVRVVELGIYGQILNVYKRSM